MNIDDFEDSQNSFEALLVEGEIHDALELRLEDLEHRAGLNCAETEAAKLSSVALVVTGFALATPITAVLSGVGAIAYAYCVANDYHQTHKLMPFPLWRKGLGELFAGVGLATTGNKQGTDADDIARAESYLSPKEAKEYRLLIQHPDRVSKWLLEQPADKRGCAYRSVIRGLGVNQVAPGVTSQSDESPAIATSSPIGTATKFGAVEVPASPAAQADWKTPETQSTVTPIVLNKLREVCDRNNSFYVAGSKGSGKGIFASNLMRWKLDQYPNAIALVLDPKGDVKESGYWRHERIRHFAFKGIALSSEQYAEKIIEFLSEARNLVSQADVTRGMRLFLVLDELLTIKESVSNALFAEFRRFGVSAISTGDSEGIHLIAITQSFNAGDSFGSDELLKNFTQVGLFREDEYTRAKKLIQFGRSNGELAESEFKALVSQSSVGRVMSIAGEFIPTPKSENHSAFDRDSGKIIQQMPLGSNPTEGDILANELNQKIQTMSVATSQTEGDESIEPPVDLVIELLKKTAAFIKDSSNQDSERWVKVNEFIKRGSSVEDKAQRKRAIATLRMKYSSKYEYRQVSIPGNRVSEQIRAIS